jgi:hypothetical protein
MPSLLLERRAPGLPEVSVVGATELTCGCGQALDCCHTGHCPRCGIALHA